MMQEIQENALVAQLALHMTRNPRQLNGLQESDAELITLSTGKSPILAVTTDSIVEEIEANLYTDPFLIGWMTVMVNLSDLAAVGAESIGVPCRRASGARALQREQRSLGETPTSAIDSTWEEPESASSGKGCP